MKLKISNFGPIRKGFGDFIEFAKVTLFCGPQGSGKSTIAKLFSTLSRIEKMLFRQSYPRVLTEYTREMLLRDLAWQGIADYLTDETEFDYVGSWYRIAFVRGGLKIEMLNAMADFAMPKIMYIPAERNFASIVRNALRVENLPESLVNLQVEFERAKKQYKAGYKLPANGFKFSFDEEKGESWILNGDGQVSRTPLHLASSGLQSIVPLLLVSESLDSGLSKTGVVDVDAFFADAAPQKRIDAESFFNRVKMVKLDRAIEAESIVRYLMPCTRFLNVVEEPEQNLYPETQCEVVDKLIALANRRAQSSLVISTHSPYIVNHLQLIAQAEDVARKTGMSESVVTQLPIPAGSLVAAANVRLYEMHLDGAITLSQGSDGFILDSNPLNRTLAEFNEAYAHLFEIGDANV